MPTQVALISKSDCKSGADAWWLLSPVGAEETANLSLRPCWRVTLLQLLSWFFRAFAIAGRR